MRAQSKLAALLRNRSGATAVEFALVVPLFLSLVFSTFEAGWMVVNATVLDRALDTTVRQIRIGSSSAPTTQDQIRTAVCAQAAIFVDCAKSLIIEMTDVSSGTFPTNNTVCVDRASAVAPVVSYSSGQRGSIMYVRACLVSNPLTPALGLALSLPKDGKGGYYLVSSSAFINEPAE